MAMAFEANAKDAGGVQVPPDMSPLERIASWAEKNPLIARLRKPGLVPPLELEPQRATFVARKDGDEAPTPITIIKLARAGFCKLKQEKMGVYHEVDVKLLKEIVLVGQSLSATIHLPKGVTISAERKSLTEALKELGYLP